VDTTLEASRARIAFGTDETTTVTTHIVTWLRERGHDVVVLADPAEWPDAGRRVGEAVASGAADLGVVCCWTGTGVSITANKVAGVRSALCTDAETACGARRWNDANVLAMGLRLTSAPLAEEMLAAFLQTSVDEDEAPRIARVEAETRSLTDRSSPAGRAPGDGPDAA
jgi:ribose 5-phosphate isomerase B